MVGAREPGGSRRLVALIERFGEAIEVDIAHYYPGERLTDLWRRRRFRYLLNLIDHLPRQSYFVETLLNDDEFAEQMALMPDVAPRERVSEWSPERVTLADIADKMTALLITVRTALGGDPERFEPVPRPRTAVERYRDAAARQAHRERVRLLIVPD